MTIKITERKQYKIHFTGDSKSKGIQPTRAMVARYIAVLMFDKKTTA